MKAEEKEIREEAAGLAFAGDKGFFYSYNVIFELDLSEHAKILYLYLCRRADGNSQTFPSYATMASACSLSRSTAIRAMKELMAEGLLLCKHQQHGKEYTSNQYLLYAAPDEEARQINLAQMERDREAAKQRNKAQTTNETQSERLSVDEQDGIEEKKNSIQKQISGRKVKTKKSVRNFPKRIGGTGVSFSCPVEPLKGQMEIEDVEEKSVKEGWCQSDTRGSVREKPGGVRVTLGVVSERNQVVSE